MERRLEDFPQPLLDTRNFSRSAQARYTTQPAFSRRIRAWRNGSGPATRSRFRSLCRASGFAPWLKTAWRRLYQGREEARRIGDVSTQTIRFAATHSLSLNFFSGWLRSIEMRSHTFNTRLDTSQFNDCIHLLQRGECHFLITYTHREIPMRLPPEHFTGKIVMKDKLVPVTLPDTNGQPVDRLPGTVDDPVMTRYTKLSPLAASSST